MQGEHKSVKSLRANNWPKLVWLLAGILTSAPDWRPNTHLENERAELADLRAIGGARAPVLAPALAEAWRQTSQKSESERSLVSLRRVDYSNHNVDNYPRLTRVLVVSRRRFRLVSEKGSDGPICIISAGFLCARIGRVKQSRRAPVATHRLGPDVSFSQHQLASFASLARLKQPLSHSHTRPTMRSINQLLINIPAPLAACGN